MSEQDNNGFVQRNSADSFPSINYQAALRMKESGSLRMMGSMLDKAEPYHDLDSEKSAAYGELREIYNQLTEMLENKNSRKSVPVGVIVGEFKLAFNDLMSEVESPLAPFAGLAYTNKQGVCFSMVEKASAGRQGDHYKGR